MKRCIVAIFALSATLAGAGATAAVPYNNPPPGKVVQDVVAYLSGEAMNSKWHVVSSKVLVGKQYGKENAYQWYLSIYRQAGNGWQLAFRSPGAGNSLVTKVEKAKGAQLYFPLQDFKIVGVGELERPAIQDVVVWMHNTGADCGATTVGVLGTNNTSEQVTTKLTVVNGCDLQASIMKRGALQAVSLIGPYYGPKAAMCCPTKNKATAILSGVNGKWSVTPKYFTIEH